MSEPVSGITVSEDKWEQFEPTEARCDDSYLHVKLAKGMTPFIAIMVVYRFAPGKQKQRNKIELSPSVVHLLEVDEDLSVEGMLNGRQYPNAKTLAEAAE